MAKSARNRAIRTRKKPNKKIFFGAKGVVASQLRRRRGVLARRFGIPDELLGGSLNQVFRRCGKATCHCASGQGHPMWTLTFSVNGKRVVEFVPDEVVPLIEPAASEGRAYRAALHEILTINAQLFRLWRREKRAREKEK